MKIIIPMAGSGERFIRSGYSIPKPLIKVEDHPIIKYIVELFPHEDDFIFICNENHLKITNLRQILKQLKPNCRIISIKPHKKGPVYTLKHAFKNVKDDEQVIVSYCDFNIVWDYNNFKKKINLLKCDGAIPCYTGFHPHLLKNNLYAGVLTDKNGFMVDIREKHRFAENPVDCHNSCGIYYFRKGSQLKKYSSELMKKNINLNGEYYVSMVYYLYKRDKLKVYVPDIKYFAQWGTPEDLEEYEAWSRHFAKLFGKRKKATTIPAGRTPEYKINLSPSSKEYKMAFEYWKNYFSKKWQI